MKKIGIITFHKADNYGAILQAHALQMTIEKSGNYADIINYRCTAIEKPYRIHIIPSFNKNIIKWCYHLLQNLYSKHNMKEKRKRCEEYRNKYLHLTEDVNTERDRKEIQKKYDAIITGSDQVWCSSITNGKDDWYCFKKTEEDGCKIISYAASVGNCEAFKEKFNDYKSDLVKYDYLSVRENDLKVYLEKKLNIEIPVVLDPTLLVEKNVWNQIAETSNINLKKNYLLYYDVDRNPISLNLAKKIAKENNLKLVHFSMQLKDFLLGVNMSYSGPNDFLKLIKDAEYIITSSFHATVFSIMFNKKFITIPHPKTGQRVISLLNNLGLKKNIYNTDDNIYSKFDIKYSDIKKSLKLYVESSKKFLIECLKEKID